MKVGDNVRCRITEVGEWGAYGKTEGDEDVFINPAEMTWRRLTSVSDIVQVDQELAIVIVREPEPDHPVFLGSIRQAHPRDDPWHEDTNYDIGSRFSATVFSVTPQMVLVELQNGAIAYANVPNGTDFREGESIQIDVLAVSRGKRTIEGRIIG